MLRDDYLAFDTEGDHRARLEQVWKDIQAARKDNQMMRLDCCADAEVKYRMSLGEGGEFKPDVWVHHVRRRAELRHGGRVSPG